MIPGSRVLELLEGIMAWSSVLSMLHAIFEVTQQSRTGAAIAQMLRTEPAPLEANPTPHNVVLPDISAEVPDIHMAAII
jgi:hypothetical protein